MEYQEIEEILNKYLEGETTLQEESMLKEYFGQPKLPVEHSGLKELFDYFNQEQRQTTPLFDVSAELNSLIKNEWERESRSRFRRIIIWIGSAAAVLVLSFGIFQYMDKPKATIKDTYDDPKLAYIETKRALLMVSRAMNSGTANLKYLSKVDESFNQVKKVAEIDKVVNSVKNK